MDFISLSLAGMTLGAVLFWGLAFAAAFLVAVLSDSRPYGATLVALLAILIAFFWKGINPFAWIAANPGTALLCVPAYLLAGIAWGMLKWGFLVRDARRRVDAAMERHVREGRGKEVSEWHRSLHDEGIVSDKPPQAAANKARIIGWMGWWPLSLLWTLVDDPVRRMFVAIYDRLGVVFQRMSDSAFEGVVTPGSKRG